MGAGKKKTRRQKAQWTKIERRFSKFIEIGSSQREDRGFRNDDEDIEVYFFRFFHDVDARRGTRNMFEMLNS